MSRAAARRYAKALLALANEADETQQVGKNLGELVATWNASNELRNVFENPVMTAGQRRDVLQALCQRMRLSTLLQNTLLLLSDRQRMRLLPQLAQSYDELAEESSGRLRAEVTTAAPMPERYYTELKKTLENVTGKTVTIDRKQDASLIGGVVTRVGDKVFDGSLKNRLSELRDELLA